MKPLKEFYVDISPGNVLNRLEAAQKEMALKISNWKFADDKSSFSCTVTHGIVSAIVKGEKTLLGNSTKVSVDLRWVPVWPMLLITLFIGSAYCFFAHPRNFFYGLSDCWFLTLGLFPWIIFPFSKSAVLTFVDNATQVT